MPLCLRKHRDVENSYIPKNLTQTGFEVVSIVLVKLTVVFCSLASVSLSLLGNRFCDQMHVFWGRVLAHAHPCSPPALLAALPA